MSSTVASGWLGWTRGLTSSTPPTERHPPRPWLRPERGLDPPPSGVDALVAAEADARAAREEVRIITTDAIELGLLASLAANGRRISVQASS